MFAVAGAGQVVMMTALYGKNNIVIKHASLTLGICLFLFAWAPTLHADVFRFTNEADFVKNFKLNFTSAGDNRWVPNGGRSDDGGCVRLDYSREDNSYVGTVCATYTGSKYPDGATISVWSNMAGHDQGRKAGVFYKVDDNLAYSLVYLVNHSNTVSWLGIGYFDPTTGDYRNIKQTPASTLYSHNNWYKTELHVEVDGGTITLTGNIYSTDGKMLESITHTVSSGTHLGEVGFVNNKYNVETSLPTIFDNFSVTESTTSSHKIPAIKAKFAGYQEPHDPWDRQKGYGSAIPAYQMSIKRRAREFPADIKFENADNLEILTYPPRVTAKYYISNFWKLWNNSSVVVEYDLASEKPGKNEFEIKFKKPPVISHQFNRIRLWGGRSHGRKADKARIVVNLTDKGGKNHSIDLGDLTGWGFSLLQSDLLTEGIALPVQVKSLRYVNVTVSEHTLILDSLEFVDDPVMRDFAMREIIPEAQFSGGKTGKVLRADDFPIPDIKFKPGLSCPVPDASSEFTTKVYSKGKSIFFEVIQQKSDKITYRIKPESGGLSDITCRIGNGEWFLPAKGGGLAVAKLKSGGLNAVREPDADNVLLGSKFVNSVLTTRWQKNNIRNSTYELKYSLKSKSLVVDMSSREGSFSGVLLGYISGITNIKPFVVPYWMVTNSFPKMAVLDDNHFLSVFFDWTITDASTLYAATGADGQGGVAINGPAFYAKKTDGTRNPVKERIYITLSPAFEEVLPAIPNPVSRHAQSLKDIVMATHMGSWPMLPDNTKVELAGWKLLRRLGLKKLMIRYHVDLYRTLDADTLGSDNVTTIYGLTNKKWAQLVSDIKGLGYLVGPYMNFNALDSTGRFSRSAMFALDNQSRYVFDDNSLRGYCVLKPTVAAYFESVMAPYLKAKYGYTMAYYDQTTTRGPGATSLDYDARMPGAASSSATLRYQLALLQDGSKVIGPIISEGHRHYMYAGFSDGSYNQNSCVERAEASAKAPLVDFALRKIHPLECDFGYHLSYAGVDSFADPDFWLASEILYGANGHLHGGDTLYNTKMNQVKTDLVLRSYYMIQQLQQYYALQPISKIEYHQDGQFYNTSQAIIENAYLEGQVHAVYANGCQTWVNYNPKKNWTIDGPQGNLVLPPYGYAGWMEGKVYQYSALDDNQHRIDYVKSPEYTYVDGRGVERDFGKVITKDAAVILNRPAGGYRVIPISGDKKVAIDLAALFPVKQKVTVTKYDENDNVVSTKDFDTNQKVKLDVLPGEESKAILFDIVPKSGIKSRVDEPHVQG